MGNTQAGSNKGALAQFYAANGADISRALVHMGKANYAQPLCDVMGIPYAPAVQGGAEGMFQGGESFVGGFDDLQNYGNSMYSKAKEKLIRDIAEDVLTALKAKNVKNVRNAPIQDVVAHLTKALPPNLRNPRKFHENFNKSSSAQREVCRALASAINKHYAGALIDVDGDESAMCNKIAEIMYSLLTGLHTEFMNVAGDAMRVMNNMQLANEYLERAYKKQKELIEQSADARLKNQSSETDKVYEEVKAEYNRQAAILANLMNVAVGPTGKSLIQSLEDNRDFVGLVKNLKAMVGTQAFGDKLSYLLSGISSVAHSAELIDKALKKIGMSAADFKSSKSAGDLRSKVFKHIMSKNPSSKQLDEMMAAAKVIYEANYDHDAISKALGHSSDKSDKSGKRGGDDHMGGDDSDGGSDGGSDDDKDGGDVMGGDDETLLAYWQRKSLKKKIDNKQKYRELVLKDFRKQLRLQLQQVVDASNEIARHVGNGIPADDQLRYFVDAFGQIRNLDKENIHFALSGYPRDSTSKEQREMFLLTYDTAMKAAEPLTKGPQGHLFKSVHGALSQMVKLIDDFNDKMVKALTEIHVDRPEDVAQALKRTASTFYGSGDSGDDIFGDGHWVAFDKVKHELAYYFSIANVKTNLGRSHEDLKSYAEDYDQILGEEAAWIIDRIKQQYVNRINDLDLAAARGAAVAGVEDNRLAATDAVINSINAIGAVPAGFPAGTTVDDLKRESKENFRSLWTFQMNAKINMIKVAQAVDLYLKAFTDGIARNPDSISSVVKMLNGVEIVAKWFNDRSGDQLASLFDFFPCGKENAADLYLDHAGANMGNTVVDAQGVIRVPNGQGHYYAYLEQQWSQNRAGAAVAVGNAGAAYTVVRTHTHLPGNPFLGRSLLGNAMRDKQCKGVLQLSQKVVKSMRALENILAAFISVGSKFGDIDPLAKTFMSPGQIFNYLCDYVAASAFTNEFAPTAAGANVAAAAYHSQTTAAELKHSDNVQTQTIPTNSHPERYRPALAGAGIDWSHNLAETQNAVLNPGAGAVARGNPNERGILVGVDSRHNAGGGAATLRNKYTQLAMSAIPAESHGVDKWKYHDVADAGTDTINKLRLDVAGWRDNFFDTDFLFQLVIKSIVAKVFTVVDAYRLFHRPVADKRAHYSLNPLRTILGGSDGGADGGALMAKVKVIPEALELYYRLVLLAEWYRENFGVDSDAQGVARQVGAPIAGPPADAWRVTLVPSIDGIWSDLVSTIFDKANYIKDGNYTETQCQRIILAINDIWSKYKSKYPKSTTRSILNAFVLEMNRAFGFLRQSDITSYLENRRANLTSAKDYDENESPFLDFDILNANEQFGSRPAPSDRFAKVADASGAKRKEINMFFLQKAIEDLRKRIDVDFLQVTQDNQYTTGTSNLRMSFAESLRNYRNDMANAKSDSDEYKVVLRMLQSANRYINVSAEKMIMVHETIAAPLTVLYAIYKVMARFNAFCHGTSLNNLAAWNVVRAAGGGGAAGHPANALTQAITARAAYNAFLVTKYTKIANTATSIPVELFTRALVGSEGAVNIPQGYLLGGAGGANQAAAQDAAIACAQLDSAHLAKDIIAALLDLGTNPSKLVTVSISQNGDINIDTSALEEACKDLLYQVKENIKKLRNNFNVSNIGIVDKYEDAKTLGSTRWLEENLLQQIFADRDEAGLPRGVQHLRDTFKTLTEKRDPATGAAANNIGADNAAYATLDNAVRGLIFYEGIANSLPARNCPVWLAGFPGNVISLLKPADTAEEKTAISELTSAALVNLTGEPIKNAANGLLPAPIILFENRDTINTYNLDADGNYKSLMQSFNKLLHMYMYMAIEDGTNKFYAPLVESFATSAGSFEVMQGKAFPNIARIADRQVITNAVDNNAQANNAILEGPAPGCVVYASNALIIRSLLNSIQQIGTAQKKKFLFDTLAEVPEFLKDRMKVNLPFFAKMFELISIRATMLKQLLNQSNLKQSVYGVSVNPTGGVGAANQEGTHRAGASGLPGTIATVSRHQIATDANTEYYNGLLTRLIECSHAMRKCAEGVYRELQDKPPAFFEMSKDFLQDYRTRNGGLPLMPFSSFLTPMTCLEGNPANWQSTDASHLGLPVRENGSNVYKYNYATRLLLNRADLDINMDHFPGAKDLYNAYANSAPRNAMLSSQEYSNTLKHTFKLGKFLLDGAVYGRLFDQPARNYAAPNNQYNTKNVFGALKWNDQIDVTAGPPVNINGYRIADLEGAPAATGAFSPVYKQEGRLSILPLVDTNGIAGVVELTENTNLNASKDRISRVVGKATGQTENLDRKRMRVLNILDAGIVPLNVHAFMREVPFVNLLNYSYTFDRMVHDFVLPSYISNGLANPAIAPPGANIDPTNLIMPPNADTNSTRELLVKLLVNPYADLTVRGANRGKEYFALLASLFNGNDNMKLGRPRYLSDQLWHKALITSSAQLVAGQEMFNNPGANAGNRYPNEYASLEAGPTAYEAVRAISRYAASNLDTVQSAHNTGQSRMNNVLRENTLTIVFQLQVQRLITAGAGAIRAGNQAQIIAQLLRSIANPTMNYTGAGFVHAHSEAAMQILLTGANSNTLFTDLDIDARFLLPANENFAMLQTIHRAAQAYEVKRAFADVGEFKEGATSNIDVQIFAEHVAADGSGALINAHRADANVATFFGHLDAGLVPAVGGGPPTPLADEVRASLHQHFTQNQAAGGSLDLTAAAYNAVRFRAETGDTAVVTDDKEAAITNAIYESLRPHMHKYVAGLVTTIARSTYNNEADATLRARINVYIATLPNNPGLDSAVRADLMSFANNGAGGGGITGDNWHTIWQKVLTLARLSHAGPIGVHTISYYISILLDAHRVASTAVTNDFLVVPSDPVATSGLKIWDGKRWAVVDAHGARDTQDRMATGDVIYCAELGRMRFDTKLVRNLVWFVQLQRIMRVVLTNHLSWINTPVVRGLKIADSKITEFEGNEQFDPKDFTGENYSVL